MDDDALNKIMSKIDAPQPDENAKKRAVNLALAEFEDVQKKNEKKSQGSSFLSRLMGNSHAKQRRETMEQKSKKKLVYGGMATAMAVVLIAGVSFTQLQETQDAAFSLQTQGSTVANLQAAKFDVAIGNGKSEKEVAPAQQPPSGKNFSNMAGNITNSTARLPGPFDMFGGGNETADSAEDLSVAEAEAPPAIASAPMAKAEREPLQRWRRLQSERTEPSLQGSHQVNPSRGAIQQDKAQTNSIIIQPPVVPPNWPEPMPPPQVQDRDKFPSFDINNFKQVDAEPVSTFSVDVDTASYSFVRGQINNGQMPNPQAVRVEEMINYFDYNYAGPQDAGTPFATSVNVMPSPWAEGRELVHIGIKGYDIPDDAEKPKTNLVFLLDVSGSMNSPNKLPLLKSSLKMLLDSLNPDDTVAIAVYAGAAGTVLEPTPVADKRKIIAALDKLRAGGGTASAQGINLAYQLAEENFVKDGVNRVMLATDGDFNVGISNHEELKTFIEGKRNKGIFLSVLGFGQGNYNDQIMQALAQNGNGVAAYIDSLNEARKVLVEEASGTLFTIAKDVKVQIEFNPATVAEYRLVGYETRHLNREDFNNDKIDAGDIGSGHTVTAIYEIVPVGSGARTVDALRYGSQPEVETASVDSDFGNEYAFLKLRYKLPDEDTSTLITTPVTRDQFKGIVCPPCPESDPGQPPIVCAACDDNDFIDTEVRFSIAVAAFAEILKGAQYQTNFTYDDVISLANSAKGSDKFGYRAEFIQMVRLAKSLDSSAQ